MPLLCLIAFGLLVSVVMLAVLVPKLGHLGVTPPRAAARGAGGPHRHRGGSHHGWLTFGHVLLLFAASFVLSVVSAAGWLVAIGRRRLENRLTREYGLYEVMFSLHDEAREQDVTDMVEALLNAVREFPEERAATDSRSLLSRRTTGQDRPGSLSGCCACAASGHSRRAWMGSSAPPTRTCGSATSSSGPPKEIGGRIPRPGHVLRFRKERSFIYPIVARCSGRGAAVGSGRAGAGRGRRCRAPCESS